MNQDELWSQYSGLILAKAKEFHRKFPSVLDLDEKVSIAWIYANKARKKFDSKKGKFITYGIKSINSGLMREISREINKNSFINMEMDEIEYNSMDSEEKMSRLITIKKSEKGELAYYNKVYGIPISELAKTYNTTPQKAWKNIKSFQKSV